jgi:hypothetical protein
MAIWTVSPLYSTQAEVQAALSGLHPDAVHLVAVAGGFLMIVDTDKEKLKNPDGSAVQWNFTSFGSNAALTAADGLAALANGHHGKVFHGPGGFGVFSVPGTVTLG